MKIGDLAKRTGCSVETIRYYEREGLLLPPLRDGLNNYRAYDPSHVERLTFIRRCRALDMAHSEIRALLQARIEPDASCGSVNELIDAHLAHVQARMAELKALEAQLMDLRGQCHAERAARDCGILRELTQPGDVSGGRAQPTHITGTHGTTESHVCSVKRS